MLASIEFTDMSVLRSLPEDAYQELRRLIGGDELPALQKDFYGYSKHIVDLDEVQEFFNQHKITFTVKKFKGAVKIGKALPELNGQQIQIHVPNISLMWVNQVKVLEDACTDALQEHLNDGWRILCVCPPNSQRRPDYIIGRSDAGEEASSPWPHQRRR